MIVCVAVDDNLGMTFNKRRQSQDRVLRERLLELTQGRDLWMNSYSVQQFGSPLPCNIIEDNDFLDNAGSHDFCFVKYAFGKISKPNRENYSLQVEQSIPGGYIL